MKTIRSVAGPVRVFAGGQTIADVPESAIPSKDIVREPSIIVKSRGHIGFTFYERPFTHKAELWSYTLTDPEVHQKFVYYYLLTKVSELQGIARATSVKLPQLGVRDTDNLRVPVPPLEVQHEIVRILDRFTELEAKLEAELEARRKQYAFYRDRLVAYELHAGPRKPFGVLAKIVRGASPRPIQSFITEDLSGVPWIKIGDVPAGGKYITDTAQRVTAAGAAKSRRVRPGDFVLSNSMSFGRPYISKIDGCIHDGWLAISEFESSFLPDFLYYLLSSDAVQGDFARSVGSSTVSNLNAETVKSILLPVPALDDQAHIVRILDGFDLLVNDLSIGLPAELAARRKQYEFYRDKLLTFEEAPA
jgi:type I restriction enzyme S subunit